ncbi:HIT domain-containing protein [Thalassotalea agariperforans]
MTDFILHPMLANDTVTLAELPLSRLLLSNDKQYPWFILVPRVNDIQDIYQLEWQDQLQFLNESSLLSELLMQVFKGDKMNVAALGNICPQLHVHHIVRFKTDAAWPAPVWGKLPAIKYSVAEIEEIKAKLVPLLESITA